MGAKFYAECTPGYYNGEGQPDSNQGFFSDVHNAGPIIFYEELRQWREQSSMEGLDIS